jgi:hypothetical protein
MKNFVAVFHMIGCPHCRAVTGPQGALAPLSRFQHLSVVEIESADPLCEAMSVNSFPTIFLVTKESVFRYPSSGDRTTEAFERWIASRT